MRLMRLVLAGLLMGSATMAFAKSAPVANLTCEELAEEADVIMTGSILSKKPYLYGYILEVSVGGRIKEDVGARKKVSFYWEAPKALQAKFNRKDNVILFLEKRGLGFVLTHDHLGIQSTKFMPQCMEEYQAKHAQQTAAL